MSKGTVDKAKTNTKSAKSTTDDALANSGSKQSGRIQADESTRQLSEKVKESARQIWLAGLGAYNKAEEDTGKIFDKLVREGEEFENLTRGVVEKRFKAVEDRVEGVKSRANDTFNKLESVFDQRVSAALKRLGIPTKKQVADLEARIKQLESRLKEK